MENGKLYIIGRYFTGKTSITNYRRLMKGGRLTEFLDEILSKDTKLGPCKRVILREEQKK